MKNAWLITKLELGLVVRDRQAVIWSLVAPLAFAWFFGMAFGSPGPPRPTRIRIDAGVEEGRNPDYVARIFRRVLCRDGDVVISDDPDAAVVTLPDGVVDRLLAGDAVEASIDPKDYSDSRANALGAKVRLVLYSLVFESESRWKESPPDSAEIALLARGEGKFRMTTATLGEMPRIPEGAEHTLPAMLVMFVLFQLTTFFMVLWVEDLRTGKIRRIVMSPTTVTQLFAAQVFSRMIWAGVQVAVILGVGSLVLRVRFHWPMFHFAVLFVAFMLASVSLGMLLASFFKSPEKANAIGVITALVLAALGGCWWPLEIVGAPMRTVAMFLPTGLAMNAIGGFSAHGPSAPFPFTNVLALATMTAVLLPVSIRRLKKQITS